MLRANAERIAEVMKMDGVSTSDEARAALDEYLDRKKGRPSEGFPAWYPFKKPMPRPHQMRALDRKWRNTSFALHHDRGTGKTRTEIDYACARRMNGDIDAVLVAVKLSGRRTWQEQLCGPLAMPDGSVLDGWAPIPVDVHLPITDHERQFMTWLNTPHDFKWMVIGIESLSQGRMVELARKFVSSFNSVLMIIDEAHLVASHKASRTERVIELGQSCSYRDTATGTPISTGPLNLFSQFEFLDPDIIGIGDYYAFRNRYAVILRKETKAGREYPLLVGYHNVDELTRSVAPYVDEIRKVDVLPDLPPKTYERAYVQLGSEQRALYDEMRRDGMYKFKGKEMVTKNVLELILRLHQVAGGFVTTYTEVPYTGVHGQQKIRRIPHWHAIVPWQRNPKIVELLDVAADDKQFIIWAAYIPEIEAIVQALQTTFPNERVCQIHGAIDESVRHEYRTAYQKGDYKFMVGNTATGGSADTWTACETMVYYSNTDRMIDREQSEDRAHRDGLTHPVLYIDLLASGSVDEVIMKSIEQKVDLSEYVRQNIKRASDMLGEAVK